jgi:hypothetical protein
MAEQTSLQEAMAKIVGEPVVDASLPLSTEVTPYSQDTANYVPTTDVSLGGNEGGGYDPFAEQQAELDAMKAETAALNAQLAASAANPPAAASSYYPPLPPVWTPPPTQQSTPAPAPVYTSSALPSSTPILQPAKTSSMNSAQQFGTNQIYPTSKPATTYVMRNGYPVAV